MAVEAKKKQDVDGLMVEIRSVLSGDYTRDLIRRCTVNLEALRPLPTTFDSLFDLMLDIFDLEDLALLPLLHQKVSVAGKARGFMHKQNREFLERTRNDLFEGQAMMSLGPSPVGWINRSNARSRNINLGKVDWIIAGKLGGGDVTQGWNRAWVMASEGSGGGVRKLRHLVLSKSIRFMTEASVESIRQKSDDLKSEDYHRCWNLLAEIVGSSLLEPREFYLAELIFFWDRIIGSYVNAMVVSLIPSELA